MNLVRDRVQSEPADPGISAPLDVYGWSVQGAVVVEEGPAATRYLWSCPLQDNRVVPYDAVPQMQGVRDPVDAIRLHIRSPDAAGGRSRRRSAGTRYQGRSRRLLPRTT